MVKILNKINQNIPKKFDNGLIIYCGINIYGEEILEIIEPELKCSIFDYICHNKFKLEYLNILSKQCNGSIIFINGKETYIYNYKNDFVKVKHINGLLIKNHKKGGQSQKRFDKLAKESRVNYIKNVIDNLNNIKTVKNWIFGSSEMLDLLEKYKKLIYVNYSVGGFINFNRNTIYEKREEFKNYLVNINNNENIYKDILYYLETEPDYLDFDPANALDMKYFITKLDLGKELLNSEKHIILNKNSKYYEKLIAFDYIALKYFNY